MIVCGTGHRPENCEDEDIVRLKSRVKLQYTPSIDKYITGMSAGFDLWSADEAIKIGLPVIAAVPWLGHTPRAEDKLLYASILNRAENIVYVEEVIEFPGPWVYHKRNEWMVDHSDAVMAYWNGMESGGTYACRQYAKKVGKPVANIWVEPPF